jgi:hypothetical protein
MRRGEIDVFGIPSGSLRPCRSGFFSPDRVVEASVLNREEALALKRDLLSAYYYVFLALRRAPRAFLDPLEREAWESFLLGLERDVLAGACEVPHE